MEMKLKKHIFGEANNEGEIYFLKGIQSKFNLDIHQVEKVLRLRILFYFDCRNIVYFIRRKKIFYERYARKKEDILRYFSLKRCMLL